MIIVVVYYNVIPNLICRVYDNFPHVYLGSAVALLSVLHHVSFLATIIMVSDDMMDAWKKKSTTTKSKYERKVTDFQKCIKLC